MKPNSVMARPDETDGEPAREWRGDSTPDSQGSVGKPRRRSCDRNPEPRDDGSTRFENMSQTDYDYVKINVHPATRRRLRIAKAERGVTYDEIISDMIEHYE